MRLSWRSLLMTALMSMALAFSGCGTTKKGNSGSGDSVVGSDNGGDSNSLEFEVNADSDSGQSAGGLRTVYFGFNSSRISGEARDALNANAEILKANESVEVQIEGHCDERGGEEYNRALGLARANRVMKYLVAKGISSSRLSTVSFGKDRPVAFGHDEEAWASNRRGNFVVTAK